ncbi:hypothetical protein BaRGS_00035009 [Batillaria attramentaria]|uniref:Novel STAND NTPase 3 domain-containing protein n=1 Tax=Batillaria attramentaria TaxID=370345 RepID=A0ABD0JFP3_9CAEN
MAGQATSLTCFFNHDLKQKNTDFAVQHHNRQGQLSEILTCLWITTDSPSCTTDPGQRLRSRFRKCKIRKRNTRSSPIHDENLRIESHPLVSVTSPRMVSTETTDNTGRETRAEFSQHETITAKFCELTREEIITKFGKYIYNRAVQLLLKTGAVVITGPERCEKSTLGRAVLDRLSDMGFYPLVLDHPKRWKEKKQSNKKHVVLLDECEVDKWSMKTIESMLQDEGCYIIFVLKSDAMNRECSGLTAYLSTTPTIDLGNIVPSDTEEMTPLLEACECDDLDKVITILSGCVEPNGTNREGKTPLHIACEHGKADIVSHLLWAECDIHSQDKALRTPLHYACKGLAQNSGTDAVNAYEDLSPRPESNDTPRETIVKDLLASGASLEVADDKGRTPLHVACEGRNHALVNILLQAGANVRAKYERGYTPLHQACVHTNRDITETLIAAKSDVDASDKNGHTPLHLACLEKANDSVEILLRAKANVDARTSSDKTPLHMACESNNCALVNILLQAGANVKAKDNTGFTPLHVACMKKAKDLADILLKANASVEARTDSGNTPLHVACNAGSKDIVIMLLDKGADTGVTNNKGQTPDELARAKYHVDIAYTVRQKREKRLTMRSAVGE